MNTYEEDQAEVLDPEQIDVGALAVLNKSEIAQQISTARQFPRSIKKFTNEAAGLVTLDPTTAAECIYALPRKDKDGKTKTIEGPSARFAEIVNYAWGNSRAGARVVGEDSEFVTSQGIFYDLEKNVAISYEVKRRITTSGGKRYGADMISVTSNAASSIALRNAVLKGIPKALWRPIYDAARKVVAGDLKTLAARREAMFQAFLLHTVTPEMIYGVLEIKGKEDIGIDQLVILSGFLTALKEGESTVESIFGHEPAAKKSSAPPITEDPDAHLIPQIEALLQHLNAAQRTVEIHKHRGRLADYLAELQTTGKTNGNGNHKPESTAAVPQQQSKTDAETGAFTF